MSVTKEDEVIELRVLGIEIVSHVQGLNGVSVIKVVDQVLGVFYT